MNYYSRNQFVTPPIVKDLLIINVLVFLTQQVAPLGIKAWMINNMALTFPFDFSEVWQLVSYMFMHANFSHLFFNMFALWMFGRILEYDLGSRKFLIYYLVCGVGAGLIQLGVNWAETSMLVSQGISVPMGVTVGASGAVFGLLLGYGMLHPNNIVALLFPPIQLKAKWFVVLYGAMELFFGIASSGSNVAHFAHLGGMLWGYLLLRYWKGKNQIWY